MASAIKCRAGKLTPVATAVAIIVLPAFIPIFSPPFWALYHLAVLGSLVSQESGLLFWGFTNDLLTSLTIIVIARCWEKESWSSIGISRFTLADPFLGVAAFLVFYMIPLGWMMGDVLLAGASQTTSHTEFWFLASTASLVLFEELATRAYIIERVITLTGSGPLAGLVSLSLSLALHVPGRSVGGALQRGPLLLILTVLYIWRRNLVPGMVTHFLTNAILFIAIAHGPWLLRWSLPSRSWIALLIVGGLYLILHRAFERPGSGSTNGEGG